jgi:hypothetical protein
MDALAHFNLSRNRPVVCVLFHECVCHDRFESRATNGKFGASLGIMIGGSLQLIIPFCWHSHLQWVWSGQVGPRPLQKRPWRSNKPINQYTVTQVQATSYKLKHVKHPREEAAIKQYTNIPLQYKLQATSYKLTQEASQATSNQAIKQQSNKASQATSYKQTHGITNNPKASQATLASTHS